MLRHVLLSVLLFATACGGASSNVTTTPSESASAPAALPSLTTREGFRDRALLMFGERAPELRTTAAGPLSLNAVDGDHNLELNLDRVWDFCQRNAAGCESELNQYVDGAIASIREQSGTPTADQLLLTVRPVEYVNAIVEAGSLPGEQIVEGLHSVVVIDRPSSAQPITAADLETLGLTLEQARATALSNLSQRFPGFGVQIAPPPADALGSMTVEDFYLSSVILLTDEWARAAPQFQRLLVAVPDPGAVIFVDGAADDAYLGITAVCQGMFQQSQRPLFAEPLEFTGSGWRIATPREPAAPSAPSP